MLAGAALAVLQHPEDPSRMAEGISTGDEADRWLQAALDEEAAQRSPLLAARLGIERLEIEHGEWGTGGDDATRAAGDGDRAAAGVADEQVVAAGSEHDSSVIQVGRAGQGV